MITAGDLRDRVTVQSKDISGVGDRGQVDFTWVDDVKQVPCLIEPLSGRRLEFARQLYATSTHQITIRYLSTLTVTSRFVDSTGKIYRIGSIVNKKSLNFSQECLCMVQESPE